MVGPARPSVLEKVDEVLRGHRCEAAVRVGGRAGVARVLWEGQGVTARAGREASSGVTRHSLKCTWTPPHRYVDSKQELGTRGCSAGRVSLPVHGAQVALSQGAGRSLRFPPPTPNPALVMLPSPPAVGQDPLWNCSGHYPPTVTRGPSTTPHGRNTQGSLVSADRTASGPGGQLGQCLETGPPPPQHSQADTPGLMAARGTLMVAKEEGQSHVTRGCSLIGPAPDRGRAPTQA